MPATVRTSPSQSDRVLLAGPHSRRKELWLVLRAVHDFIRGFRALHFVGPCVTVFGSARFGEDHPFYATTRELGRRVSRMGFTVMTGGGPGLMEAANRGAKDAGGLWVGCNIRLAHEQASNPYLDRWVHTGKIGPFPVVLIGRSYWQPLVTLLTGMRIAGTIAAEDAALVLVTDDLDEAVDHLERGQRDRSTPSTSRKSA